MKILEMRPRSYDQRMEKISKGRIRTIKEAVAGEVLERSTVLEIGCGTGELAKMLAERGCKVEGFDLSLPMVEAARKRIETENLKGRFSTRQLGVDGMDGYPDENFDAVVSTLVFSELNDDERRFALKHAARVLRPGKFIIIADEVVPRTVARRAIHAILRLPMLAMTFLVAGKSTRPIKNLGDEIRAAGFIVDKEVRSHGDSFAIVVGRRKKTD